MWGQVLGYIALCCLTLAAVACPQQIKQTVQTAKQLQQGLPQPSSAPKSWHVIASGKRPGFQHTLAVVNGCPAVAYYENHQIYFAQAIQPVPQQTADWLVYDMDSAREEGAWSELAQLGGKPVLIYSVRKPRQPVLAIATSPAPQSAADWQRFDLPDNRYAPGQVAEIDGRLAIATLRRRSDEERERKDDAANRELVFLRQPDAGTLNPAEWSEQTIPLEVSTYSFTIRLIEYQGLPLLSFISGEGEGNNVHLWRARTADPQCAEDWEKTMIVENEAVTLLGNELKLHDGQPVLAYELGDPSKLNITLAKPGAKDSGFDLTSFTLADLGDYGSDIALASHDGKLCVGWSFWAQVFVFESETPALQSKDDFRSYFLSESPGKETVSDCELAVCGGKLVGTYLHEGTPGELRFVAFQ